jgi:hypothetical protein
MSNSAADVLIHIDQTLDHERLASVTAKITAIAGVNSAQAHDAKPHLIVVTYDPEKVHATDVLSTVKAQGVGAELVGL